jgi:peptide deformylase
MSVLPIYNCFHPIMRNKAKKVEVFDQALVDFVNDMLDTMEFADGVGLAANQVGSDKAILVIDEHAMENDKSKFYPRVMINPEIISFSDETVYRKEGCLSIPQVFEEVERPAMVQVRFTDLDMKEYTIETDKFLSRVIQHEVDHLNALLFTDRLTPLKKALLKNKLKKIQRGITDSTYDMIQADGSFTEGIPDEDDDQ